MTQPTPTKTALILGATGGIGGASAAALARHGWRVRALARRPQTVDPHIEWILGDAMNAADVAAAARGAQLIVHAVNPPGYRDWDRLVLPMLDNTIAAAQAEGARIILPGTIYNFGPDAFPLISEGSPQTATSRKGRIRIAMERRLRAASTQGARALIIRAGDYFGPGPLNNWFSQVVVKPGAPLKAVTEIARHGATHAWAYLPDLGEVFALLADQEATLPPFETVQFAGFQLAPGEMAAAVRRVTDTPRLPVRRFPWAAVLALSPFVRLFGELAEISHFWRHSVALDGRRLEAFLGPDLPRTRLDDAIADTLIGLGCLPVRGAQRPRLWAVDQAAQVS